MMTDTRRLADALMSESLLPGRQRDSAFVEIAQRPMPDSWINSANVGRLAKLLAPNMMSLLSGEERAPLADFPDAPGKVPSTGDPRYAEALAEAVMIGSSFVPLGGAGRAATVASRLSSKSPFMYNPPAKPPRPFAADYPQGARADAAGRLTHDIEGRPLTAQFVAGRNVVGGADEALAPAQFNTFTEATTGRGPATLSAREMGGDFGRTLLDRSGQPYAIQLRKDMRPDKAAMVHGHELGHVVDQIAGLIPTKGLRQELRGVYNTLNNPNRIPGGLEASPYGKPATPQAQGYKGEEIPREYMVEAVRAYLANPNYIKTVAPQTAKAIRAAVNSSPNLNRIIQFNSLAGAGLFAPLAFPLAGTDRRPEQPTQ
jgi:hypothetical protein